MISFTRKPRFVGSSTTCRHCAQFLLFAATLLGVDGYYDKMRDLIKK